MGALADFLRNFRKFHVETWLATQYFGDLPPGEKAAIFGNVTKYLAFASSAAEAASLAKEFGGPEAALVAEMLPELPLGQALVKVRGQPVVRLRVLPARKPTHREIEAGKALCLRLGATRDEIDRQFAQRRRDLTSLEPRVRDEPHDLPGAEGSDLPEGYDY